MIQGNLRCFCLVLVILLLTIGFGCSHGKAFKSGIIYTCDEGKSFVVELYEKVDIAFLKIEEKWCYLHRMPSESGTKYGDGNTTLWMKGQSASVEVGGRTEFNNCSIKPK